MPGCIAVAAQKVIVQFSRVLVTPMVGDIYPRPSFPRRCLRLPTAGRPSPRGAGQMSWESFRPDKYRDEQRVGQGCLCQCWSGIFVSDPPFRGDVSALSVSLRGNNREKGFAEDTYLSPAESGFAACHCFAQICVDAGERISYLNGCALWTKG